MKPVPTAEAFYAVVTKGWDDYRPIMAHEVQAWMIEYARLHREAILEAAADTVPAYIKPYVKDCYPVELIK